MPQQARASLYLAAARRAAHLAPSTIVRLQGNSQTFILPISWQADVLHKAAIVTLSTYITPASTAQASHLPAALLAPWQIVGNDSLPHLTRNACIRYINCKGRDCTLSRQAHGKLSRDTAK